MCFRLCVKLLLCHSITVLHYMLYCVILCVKQCVTLCVKLLLRYSITALHYMLYCVTLCKSVLQCFTVLVSVLQYVTVWCNSVLYWDCMLYSGRRVSCVLYCVQLCYSMSHSLKQCVLQWHCTNTVEGGSGPLTPKLSLVSANTQNYHQKWSNWPNHWRTPDS